MQPDFKGVHRIGKAVQGKPRETVAGFARFPDRVAVFQEGRKLAKINSRIYINTERCKNMLRNKENVREKAKTRN